MLIVFVIDTLDSGNGTTVTTLRTAERLRARGHRVRILTHSDGAASPDVVEVGALRVPVVAQVAALHHFRLAHPDRAAIRHALADADLVHIMLPSPLGAAARSIACELGIAVTAGFHVQPEHLTYNVGLHRVPRIHDGVHRLMWRRFYRHIAHIHCPTEHVAAELRRHGYRAHLHVISNGVPPEFHPADDGAEPWTPASGRPFRIVSIGRLAPEKRLDVLIDAVARSAHRDRIELMIAGRGPHRLLLELRARRRRVAPHIGYHAQHDLIALMQTADLYVHPADAEIESLACLEAIACGLVPVISDSPASAARQWALDERSLFAAGDPADLARRIDHWIEHPHERARLRARYAEHAEHFRLERSVDRLEEMFERAVATAGRSTAADATGDGRPGPIRTEPLRGRDRVLRFVHRVIGQPASAPITRLAMGTRVHGRGHLRNLRGGAVLVCTHVHPLDCLAVVRAAAPRLVRFNSQEGNFGLPVAGAILRVAGTLAIPAGPGASRAFLTANERVLAECGLVCVYPEGALAYEASRLRPLRIGAFTLATRADVPVVPIVLRRAGTLRVPWRRARLDVVVGAPLRARRNPRAGAAADLRDRTAAAMRAMLRG